MKLFVITVIVVILAIDSQAASLVKRESPEMPPEVEKITNYFKDLVQNLKTLESPEFASKANAYIEQSKAQLMPMVEKLQEQLQPLNNVEDQLANLAVSVRAQITPYTSMVQSQLEEMLKLVVDQTKAILPSQ